MSISSSSLPLSSQLRNGFIEGAYIDRLVLSPRGSVHDFDLAFQLRYLKKIDKLGEVNIVGIPQEGKVDYFRIQSILRKLVAHDMQGS